MSVTAAVSTALWLVWLVPANGQAPAAGKAPAKAAASKAAATQGGAAPKSNYVPPRTADGQPDIQGVYARAGVGGLAVEARESNGPHGGENPLDATANNPLSVSDRPDGLRNVPRGFNVGGMPVAGPPPAEKRALGIIEPGKVLPWAPGEDKRRRDFLMKTNPAASLQYVEFDARCALPGLFLGNGPFQFIQPPQEVVILSEYSHFTRNIHLDGRPHLSKSIRLFLGDSIGKWEGNTLTVDTTNFNEYQAFTREVPYLSDALHTIERLTIADQNNMDYEVTVDDPKLFSHPWKTAGLYRRAKKEYEIIEYACTEGSLTLENIFGPYPTK